MSFDERAAQLEADARRIGTTVANAAQAWVAHKKKLAMKRLGWLLFGVATFVLGLALGLQIP